MQRAGNKAACTSPPQTSVPKQGMVCLLHTKSDTLLPFIAKLLSA